MLGAGTATLPRSSEAQLAQAPVVSSVRAIPWVMVVVALLLTCAAILAARQQIEVEGRQAIAIATRDNENLAQALEEHVVRTLMIADELAWTIKQQVERRGVPADLNAFVSERTLPGTPVLLAHVTDETGAMVRHTHSTKPLQIATRLHFKAHVDSDSGRLVIGEPMVGGVSGKWSLHVSRRINKSDGTFGGVVTIALDQEYFSNFYRQVELGPAGFIMLVGKDGIVRARDGRVVDVVGERLRSMDLLDRVGNMSAGTYVASAANGHAERLISFRTLPRYRLVVAVGTSVDQALAQHFENRLDYVVGATIISVLLWIGLGLFVWSDAKQRRAAVQLQEANERAEAANRMKSEFLANMTHELRTPLNGIIGFADCLKEDLEDDGQRECAQTIYSSGCTLLGMVNSVLDLAKIEAGRMELHTSIEPVRLLLEELCVLHGEAAGRKGLKLEVVIGEDVPAEVRCDRLKLQQVLNNLIVNALEHTERGSVVLAARMRPGVLSIAVSDTGRGIAPALQQAMVERAERKEQSGGGIRGEHGLGLALAFDLVHLMGGSMEIASKPEQGSEFRVLLPVDSPAPAKANA